MNTCSIHRWLADGFIAGEQVTPGAPWQIRITDELRSRIVQQAPPEYLPMMEATAKLGVSRQTVLQRVKRGELKAVLVRQGRRKGLRIKVVDQQPSTFSVTRGQYGTDPRNRSHRRADRKARTGHRRSGEHRHHLRNAITCRKRVEPVHNQAGGQSSHQEFRYMLRAL